MRQPTTPRRALRFAIAIAIAAVFASAVLGVAIGCGPNAPEVWICLNPATGLEDVSIYDANHYDDAGVFDPCHCYDPCGPAKSCPIPVDAGPRPSGCDGDAGDGGDAGG